MVGRLNEPEKQPNKPQEKDLGERKPGRERVCGGCVERHSAIKPNPAHA